MDEQEIDLIDIEQLEAALDRRLEGALLRLLRRHLGGDEDVLALDAGGADAFRHLSLVLVAGGGVDGAVADLQRLGDAAGAVLAGGAERAVADDGHACPVCRDHLHRPILPENACDA